jgi:hypothetical protein
MAVKQTTGIIPTMIKYGRSMSAVRRMPKAFGKRPAVIILHECYGSGRHRTRIVCKYESDYSRTYNFTKNIRME